MCLAQAALGWAGLVRFLRVRCVRGWFSQWGLVLKLWQEDGRYWSGWQCGQLMCIQWVEPEFETLATAVSNGSRVNFLFDDKHL